MQFLTIFLFQFSSISYGQSEIIDRFQKAAEVEFGFYDTVYPDTFLVQNYRMDTTELYFIVQPYDPSKRNPELFAYRRSDSSALNGTIIYQQFKNEYYQNSFSQSYTRNARLYENGQQIRLVSRGYFRYSTSYFADEPRFDGTLFDPIKNGFSQRQLSGGGYRYDYMNDTLTLIYFDGTHNSDTPNAMLNTNYWTVRHISDEERKLLNIPYKIVLSKKPEREYFYLQSENRKETDIEVLESFLKKNKKRNAALTEN